jgi:Uma2 family endonuclease
VPETKNRPLVFNEYLALETSAEIRHELVDGEMRAMVGGTDRHNEIVFGLRSALRARCNPDCRVYSESVKLKLNDCNSRYPDVILTCSEADHEQPLYKTEPRLLAEVLSDSSWQTDRVTKLNEYQQLASVEIYLILSQESPTIECYSAPNWKCRIFGLDDQIPLPMLSSDLPVREIYQDVLISMGLTK